MKAHTIKLFLWLLLFTVNGYAEDWQQRFDKIPEHDLGARAQQAGALWKPLNRSINLDMKADQWPEKSLFKEADFKRFSERWQVLDAKLTLRELLIPMLPLSKQDQVLAFGPSGVWHLKLELHSLQLRASHALWLLYHGAHEFVDDSMISPVAILVALFKLSLLLIAFSYWRRAAVPAIKRQSELAEGLKPLICWWYMRLRGPFEWLILLSFVISAFAILWEFIDFHPLLVLLQWSLGGVIVLRFVDSWRAFSYRGSNRKDLQSALRLRSIKLAGFLFVVVYASRAFLHSLEAGGGTLHYWIKVLFIWLLLPAVLLILSWWKPVLLARIESGDVGDNPLLSWIKQHPKGLIALLSTVLAVVYLSLRALFLWCLAQASQKESVKTWMAYFFRVEVARQAAKDGGREALEAVSGELINNLHPNYQPKQWLETIALAELERVAEVSRHHRSTISLLHGGRGAGKSSFLQRLKPLVADQQEVLYVECLPGGFNEVVEQLALALGIEEGEGRAKAVIGELKSDTQRLVCIDDMQRIICPAIGGLRELERLARLIRNSSQSVSWVLAIETPSWRFVERARGERFLFDVELELPRWSDEQINALILQRISSAGIDPSFATMEIPNGLSQVTMRRDQPSSESYTRVLWEYAKGNPRITLGLWRRSLYFDQQGQMLVKLFEMPDTTELDSLKVTLMLVLRAVLQLELGQKADIARCTNLSSDEVVDALRLLVSRGYVERIDERYYGIKWFWYRAIISVLDRQHLLKI